MKTSAEWNKDPAVIQGVAIGTPSYRESPKISNKMSAPNSPNVWKSNRQTVYNFRTPTVKQTSIGI